MKNYVKSINRKISRLQVTVINLIKIRETLISVRVPWETLSNDSNSSKNDNNKNVNNSINNSDISYDWNYVLLMQAI